jgi:hypothetical protein
MITRRMAIGSGLAVAGLCGLATDTFAAVAASRRKGFAVEALLIDQTIAMPQSIAGFAATKAGTLQVVGIDLDARAHPALLRVLAGSKAIAGISSGAALFCLERLAWDHGFRLTERRARPAIDTRWQDMAAFLDPNAGAPEASGTVRHYAPSRADGLLHSWIMQKRAPAPQHPGSGAYA